VTITVDNNLVFDSESRKVKIILSDDVSESETEQEFTFMTKYKKLEPKAEE